MSVHFNPNNAADTRVLPVIAESTRSYNTFCGGSTLSSLKQQGGEDDGVDQPTPTVSKDEADRGFCGTLCYVLTAPFRAIAYIATSVWECLFGKKAVEVDEEPAKPVKRTSEFEQALKAKEVDPEELESAFQRLPSNHKTKIHDLLWQLSGKEVARKDFEKTMHDLDDKERKELKQLSDTQARLARFTPFVRAQKIKDMAEEEQPSAKLKAMKEYHKLSKGDNDGPGASAKGRLVSAALVLRGIQPKTDDLGSQEDVALGKFDAAVKEAIERLVKFNMHLLPTQKARDSIREFVEAISSDRRVTAERIKQQVKSLDPEAAKVLNLAVSHAKDKPGRTNFVTDCVPADAGLVLHVATLISAHDNGNAHSGNAAAAAAGGEDDFAYGGGGQDRRLPSRGSRESY